MNELRHVYSLLSATAKRRLLLLLLLMLLGSVAEMASLGAVMPLLTLLVSPESAFKLPVIGIWLQQQPTQKIVVAVGGLFMMALFAATLIRIWLLHASNQFAHRTGYELTTRAFKILLAQPYLWHVQHHSSHQLTQLNRVNQFIIQNVQPMLVLITSIFLGLGILVVLFVSEPVIMSLMALFVTLFYVVTIVLVRRRLAYNGTLINHAAVAKTRILQESLGGIRDIILDHSQEIQSKGFGQVEAGYRQALITNDWVSQLPRYLIEFFGIATIVVLALVFTEAGNTPITTLGLLALGSQRLLPLAQKVYESLNMLRVAAAARSDVIKLLSLPDHLPPVPEQALPFESQLSFDAVHFCYPTSPGWVLNNLSLTLGKGERIGIVGPSGGGKSTLMDLLMGLLEPTQGKLIVDDRLLTRELLPAWRRRIAHVPQSIFLLDATLRENIALGIPPETINEDRMACCIAQSQLSQVVADLPNGEYTLIGERGVLLSGGQRQRIGIARALYRQADVLVMDEATSALDSHTEGEVIAAIGGLGPDITVVMIAHRLTTLSFCDRILHIEAGQLVRETTYAKLITDSEMVN